MSESNKRNFIVHGSILAIAGILVRIIGMLYRIPVVNIIGSEGNGIYGAAFNIYNIMLVLSSYGQWLYQSLCQQDLQRKDIKVLLKY